MKERFLLAKTRIYEIAEGKVTIIRDEENEDKEENEKNEENKVENE